MPQNIRFARSRGRPESGTMKRPGVADRESARWDAPAGTRERLREVADRKLSEASPRNLPREETICPWTVVVDVSWRNLRLKLSQQHVLVTYREPRRGTLCVRDRERTTVDTHMEICVSTVMLPHRTVFMHHCMHMRVSMCTPVCTPWGRDGEAWVPKSWDLLMSVTILPVIVCLPKTEEGKKRKE